MAKIWLENDDGSREDVTELMRPIFEATQEYYGEYGWTSIYSSDEVKQEWRKRYEELQYLKGKIGE